MEKGNAALMAEVDLNEESTRFANVYLQKKWGNISDLVRKHDILNSAGHGFFAGVRFAEQRLLGEKFDGRNQETLGRESTGAETPIPANQPQ